MKGSSGARLMDREESAAYAAGIHAAGRTVVFTNGVFDLLHPGHVRYLREAASLGDVLIVGLNTDASVRRNKGAGRPITPELERAEMVGALDCVSAVTLFDEDTPARVIQAVQPDVLVKGADGPADQIVGRDTVEARGGRVVRIAVEQGHSTTAILDRVRKTPTSEQVAENSSLSGHKAEGSLLP
jgi:D-beta-D-heptose 7-phosphate kinase/D-beta-D-heptose 1-phosphate adenosyltransferase